MDSNLSKCKYCGEFFNKNSIGGHVGHCKSNPNYKRNKEINKIANQKRSAILVQKKLDEKQKDELTRRDIKFICPKCGKEFYQSLTEKELSKGFFRKFCSSSCGNSHGPRTEDFKEKIREKILIKSIFNPKVQLIPLINYNEDGYLDSFIKKEFRNQIIEPSKRYFEKICCTCGAHFFTTCFKSRFCTRECIENDPEIKKIRIDSGIKAIQSSKEKGTWKPWQSRNIIFYPEKFWITVLDNNKISYEREFFLDKKYFLDFLIKRKDGIKIDLEIDGHQHKFRKEHDKERDEYINSKGILVYRIEWNEINSENGSIKMKEKIDKFLEFYNI